VTIIITDDDVKRLLPMAECIEAMRVAFRDFAAGDAVNRPRSRYLARHPDRLVGHPWETSLPGPRPSAHRLCPSVA